MRSAHFCGGAATFSAIGGGLWIRRCRSSTCRIIAPQRLKLALAGFDSQSARQITSLAARDSANLRARRCRQWGFMDDIFACIGRSGPGAG
jgi:hypothetical protein